MAIYGVNQTQGYSQGVSGTALTAAASAEMLPAVGRWAWSPSPPIKVGDIVSFKAFGKISCVVTTPGTARFDLRIGSTVIADSGALNLNVVAKTNVPWWLDFEGFVSAIGSGTSATLTGLFRFTSEAVVGAPANSAGGNGVLLAPVGGAVAGSGFDSTVTNVVTANFTQTVGTGSMTCLYARWNMDT